MNTALGVILLLLLASMVTDILACMLVSRNHCKSCIYRKPMQGVASASEEYSEEIFPGLDNLPLHESMRQKHYKPSKKKFK